MHEAVEQPGSSCVHSLSQFVHLATRELSVESRHGREDGSVSGTQDNRTLTDCVLSSHSLTLSAQNSLDSPSCAWVPKVFPKQLI